MWATTIGEARREEMGYNLIRMRIMSGYLAVKARGLLLCGKCSLDVLHSPVNTSSQISACDSVGGPRDAGTHQQLSQALLSSGGIFVAARC